MTTAIVFDCETGGMPEDVLKTLFREKTYDEFSATCDQRWKEDTRKAKYQDHKATAWQDYVDKAALSAVTGRLVAIGVKSEKGAKIIDAMDEAKTLRDWWSLCQQLVTQQRRCIGHNIFGFDLPFMVRRSWLLGLDVPAWLLEKGRYWHPIFGDTMAAWGCGQREYVGIGVLAQAIGLDGKPDADECSGATFAKLWTSGDAEQRARAEKYLRHDLDMAWGVAERMGML